MTIDPFYNNASDAMRSITIHDGQNGGYNAGPRGGMCIIG